MCLTWGIQDSGLCNFLQCVLGFEFESKIIPFSVMKFTQSLFIFAFSLIHAQIIKADNQQAVLKVYILSVGIFGLLSLAVMLGFKYKPRRSEIIKITEF